MGSVGLLYVGAVLFVNGLMLLGYVSGKAAAAMNLFVGGMQVIFPTLTLLTSGGDPDVILSASGLFLFGFTYLYVAWNQLTGASGEGLGWFSLFVALCAVVYGLINLIRVNDPVAAVMWFSWAVLWWLFFLVLARGRERLTKITGWYTVFVAFIPVTIPAFLLLLGAYQPDPVWAAILAVLCAASLGLAWLLGNEGQPASAEPVLAEAASGEQ